MKDILIVAIIIALYQLTPYLSRSILGKFIGGEGKIEEKKTTLPTNILESISYYNRKGKSKIYWSKAHQTAYDQWAVKQLENLITYSAYKAGK